MKNFLLIGALSLITLAVQAQLEVPKSSSGAASQTTRLRINADANRIGQTDNAGTFKPFALLEDVTAVSGGAVTRVNSVTPNAGNVIITTADIAENTNLYYTQTRARSAVSASGAISYNSATGGFTFAGTKTDVGLNLVDNTADASKPVSGPQQSALNLKSDAAVVIPYTTVAAYTNLSTVTAPAAGTLKFIVVTTDGNYSETSSLYFVTPAGKILKVTTIKEN